MRKARLWRAFRGLPRTRLDVLGMSGGGDGQNRTADLWVMNPSL